MDEMNGVNFLSIFCSPPEILGDKFYQEYLCVITGREKAQRKPELPGSKVNLTRITVCLHSTFQHQNIQQHKDLYFFLSFNILSSPTFKWIPKWYISLRNTQCDKYKIQPAYKQNNWREATKLQNYTEAIKPIFNAKAILVPVGHPLGGYSRNEWFPQQERLSSKAFSKQRIQPHQILKSIATSPK